MTRYPDTPLGPRRRLAAGAVSLALLAALVGLLVPLRDTLSVASTVLLLLVPVTAAAVLGGMWPGLATAVVADMAANFFFVTPYYTFTVDRRDNVVTLIVYVLVAATVAIAVEAATRQRERAARRDAEATLLTRATTRPAAQQSLPDLLDQVRTMFGRTAVALQEQTSSGEQSVAQVGVPSATAPAISARADDGLRLVGWGPTPFAEDQGLLNRLAGLAARTLETQRLAGQAAQAHQLAEIDRLRSALLAAVGHDLRTPLASIKAAASSLREPDVTLPPEAAAELLATIEQSADRLDALVDNLLSMSRLQAGVLSVTTAPVPLDAVVAAALLHLPTGGPPVAVDIPDDLPPVRADAGLLERVIVNLVSNAAAVCPPGDTVRLHGHRADDHHGDEGGILLHVIDHGPGVPDPDKDRMFAPFQRLDDRTADGGLGLGLAIARGFTEAMGATLTPTDTPDGGLTMTLHLPVAP